MDTASPSEMLVPNYSHTPELIFTHECDNLKCQQQLLRKQ